MKRIFSSNIAEVDMGVPRDPERRATEEALAAGCAAGRVRLNEATGAWNVASFEAARAVLTDRSYLYPGPVTLSTSAMPSALHATVQRGLHLHSHWLGFDRSEHMRVRQVAAAELIPRSLIGLEQPLYDRATRLLDRAIASGDGNLADGFVRPFVHDSLMDLCAVPADSRATTAHCAVQFGGFFDVDSSRIMRAAVAQAVFAPIVDRLLETSPSDDAIVLRSTQFALRHNNLAKDEAVGLMSALLFAGLLTTDKALGNLIALLASETRLRTAIESEPALMDTVVEESLRTGYPQLRLERFAPHVVPIRDGEIPAGARLVIDSHAVNHDPERFPRPDVFDPSRRGRDGSHLVFGAGIHRCLGRHLARMELKIAATTFLKAFPRLSRACTGPLTSLVT